MRVRKEGPPIKVQLLREKDLEIYEDVFDRIVSAMRKLEGYNPDLDDHLIDEIARCAAYIRKAERWLDDPDCTPEQFGMVSDAIVKHSARMRASIKDLAISRADRLREKDASQLVKELNFSVDKVIYGHAGSEPERVHPKA